MRFAFKEKAAKGKEGILTSNDEGYYDGAMVRCFVPALLLAAAFAMTSCATTKPQPSATPTAPIATQSAEPAASPPASPPPSQPKTFDPSTVTQEMRKSTFSDAQILIEKLNSIIQAKDFDAWKTYLTPAYIAYYSDPVVLARLSESPVLKNNGIVLHSLQDYFLQVVYRSRQNARLDDIEFISEDSIVAITLSPQGDRLVLYDLQRQNDSWKIGIGR